MKINWKNDRDLAKPEEIDEFERVNNLTLTKEHRDFLEQVTNGGRALQILPVPTLNCPGGAGDLDGVYGVNHPNRTLDLLRAISVHEVPLPGLMPFAYDEGNGQIFIDLVEAPGTVLYVPPEELAWEPMRPYFVAHSIGEFLTESAKLSELIDTDELV